MKRAFTMLASVFHRSPRTVERQAEWIDMMVHDLRAPLTAISSNFNILSTHGDDLPPEMRQRFVANTRLAIRRLTTLLDDISIVSKIESRELSLQLETVSVADFLRDCLENFEGQAYESEIRCALDCPPDLLARFDPLLIGRVIENLIGNAFKYTPKGGVIQVAASAEGRGVRFSVRDNGSGIPDEYKQRIFEKYFQSPDHEGQRSRQGTGLGLTFCRLVVEAHDGRIRVEDAEGGGSNFMIWLPR